MKKKVNLVFSFLIFSSIAFADPQKEYGNIEDIKCENKFNNNFASSAPVIPGKSDTINCTFEKRVSRSQSSLYNLLNALRCNDEINIDFNNTTTAQGECRRAIGCLKFTRAKIKEQPKEDANALYCSTKFLAESQNKLLLEESLNNLIKESSKNGGIDKKIINLTTLLKENVDSSKLKKVHFCKEQLDPNEKCFKKVGWMPNEAINSVRDKILSKSDDYKLVQATQGLIRAESLRKSLTQNNYGKMVLMPADDLKKSIQIADAQVVNLKKEIDGIIQPTGRANSSLELMVETVPVNVVQQKLNARRQQEYFVLQPPAENGVGEKVKRAIKKKLDTMAESDHSVDYSSEEGHKVLGSFGVDLSKIDRNYSLVLANIKDDDELSDKYGDYLVESANAIFDQKCSESILFNQKNMCSKLESEYRDPNSFDKSKNALDEVSKFVTDNQSQFKDINPNRIADAKTNSVNKKFNYNAYLNNVRLREFCYNVYGDNVFDGDLDEIASYLSEKSESATDMIASSRSQTVINLHNAAQAHEKDDPSNSQRMRETANFYNKETKDVLSGLSSSVKENEMMKSFNNSGANSLSDMKQALGPSGPGGTTGSTDSSFMPDKSVLNGIANSARSATSSSGMSQSNYNYQAPIITPSAQSIGSDSKVNDNSSIQKRIDELTKKENELKDKADQKQASNGQSEEMKQLQKEIEELRNQLAETKKDALGNKMLNGKNEAASNASNNIVNNLPDMRKNSFASVQASAVATRREDSKSSESNDSGNRFEERNNGAMGSSAAGALGAIGGRSGGQSASGGSSSGSSGKSFGLVLTKSGESTEDLSKIAENPKEADILFMAEKSNGQPFLIKENGALIQIQVKLDKFGKPVIVNGHPELIKKKLSKDAEAKISKDFNAIREAKTVRDTVRLQELNKTVNEAKK